MTSHSTTSMPGIVRGRSASVAGSVWASLRQGIWMMSFDMDSAFSNKPLDDAGPRNFARALVARVAHRGGRGAIRVPPSDGRADRLRIRLADESVDAVHDEFVRAARVGRSDDRLPGQERFN